MAELRPQYTTPDARDVILEAALTLFARSGFDGSTMRLIAQEAGVSPGLIHHHFKDKETLWSKVGECITEDFLAAIEPSARLPVSARTIPDMVGGYLRYWKSHPAALRFQLWRVMGAQETERRARSERLNQLFVPLFAAAQKAGFVRDDIPPGQAMITTGGLIQYWLHSRIEVEDAIAVGGGQLPDENAFLDYVLSLIAPVKK
jgi:AcrR family transcriptional regulator